MDAEIEERARKFMEERGKRIAEIKKRIGDQAIAG